MKGRERNRPGEKLDLATLFRHASRLMARQHHGRGRKHKAGHAQGRVLHILSRTGPISQSKLLEILDVRSSSLSELLAKLESAGLVRRERNEADKRGYVVSATEAAGELLAERESIDGATADAMFACLDEDERQALHRILEKLVASLKEQAGPGDTRRCGGRGKHRGRG